MSWHRNHLFAKSTKFLTFKKRQRSFSLPLLSTYAKIISLFTISLAQALMLPKCPTHSKAFSAFNCSVCLVPVYVLNEPFKAFLRLSVNADKISIQLADCKKIDVCNFAILLQIVQMPLSPCAYRLFFFGGQSQIWNKISTITALTYTLMQVTFCG